MNMLLSLAVCVVAVEALSGVTNLTTEGMRNPLAVDIDWITTPRFAWMVTGGEQQSYRVLVWRRRDNATVWDSGIVNTSSTTQIPFGGSSLEHDTDYQWHVRVVLAGHSTSKTSPVASFSVGLDSAAWAKRGQWIGGCASGDESPQLRRSFTLPSASIDRARIYATGLGLYTLHVNGERVGSDVLMPGWSTVPTARVLANTYDVTDLLKAGQENVVGMRLGQGKYGYVNEFCAAGDASCYGSLLELHVTQGTNMTVIESDLDWRCSVSPITFNHLFNGETHNASMEQPGWDAPGFTPKDPWDPVKVIKPNNGLGVALVSPAQDPMRIMSSHKASRVSAQHSEHVIGGGQFVKAQGKNVYWVKHSTSTKNFVEKCEACPGINACEHLVTVTQAYIDGLTSGPDFNCSMLPTEATWVFDFGKNRAGFCTVQLPDAVAGTVLTMVHGEIVTTDGNVDNTFGASVPPRTCPNRINCADQMDQYVYGSGPHARTWTPSFTFHGFRYVAMFGWPGSAPPPTASSLMCHQVYSSMADGGHVHFNNSVLNAIQEAIVLTQKGNMLSIPSDCPTREKRGWMGDAQVTVDQVLCNLEAGTLYENWLRTFSDSSAMSCSQSKDTYDPTAPPRPDKYTCCGDLHRFGCQAGLTPKNATGSLPDVVPFDSISGWPADWVWQVAGQVIPHALLLKDANVPALLRLWPYISQQMTFATSNAGTDDLLHWGPYGDWLGAEPVSSSFAENWYFYRGATFAAEMASALGKAQEAVAYTAVAARVAAALTTKFFDQEKKQWDGSHNMNAQAMALAVSLGGAVTAAAAPAIAQHMVDDLTAHNYHPTGGLASIRWVLQGLTAGNRTDLALRMATVSGSPGWAYMITEDMPGTIWENWQGDAHHSSGSKNHPMFTGGVGEWMYSTALGVQYRHQIDPLDADDEAGPMAAASLRSSALGGDPRAWGLTHSDTAAALDMASAANVPLDVRSLVARAAALGVPLRRPVTLRPLLTVLPEPAIMAALGEARGWRQVPQGRVHVAWQYQGGGPVSLRVLVPPGVTGRLALPLAVLHHVSLASGRVRVIVRAATTLEDIEDNGIALLDAFLHFNGADQGSCRELASSSSHPRAPVGMCVTHEAAHQEGLPRIADVSIASRAELEGRVSPEKPQFLVLHTGYGMFDVSVVA